MVLSVGDSRPVEVVRGAIPDARGVAGACDTAVAKRAAAGCHDAARGRDTVHRSASVHRVGA